MPVTLLGYPRFLRRKKSFKWYTQMEKQSHFCFKENSTLSNSFSSKIPRLASELQENKLVSSSTLKGFCWLGAGSVARGKQRNLEKILGKYYLPVNHMLVLNAGFIIIANKSSEFSEGKLSKHNNMRSLHLEIFVTC